MARTTIAALRRAAEELTTLTGRIHHVAPKGGGVWTLSYRFAGHLGPHVLVTDGAMRELLLFMDAYRRGYGACLDDKKRRKK